ncbi:MAG: alanine--tRNA ligase, partial [Anaerolineales bacterium]|nr:alanine--tRNA ligase [Anaerolineales bacterium]
MPKPTLSSKEIRQKFLDFFADKGHTIVPSASLIPHNDPTLLFTNAGMNQFKDVFLGVGSRPYTRVADSQKCMRVSGKHNDLEDVGKSAYHHTFFEMLGNWSFGDYYKREAIQWAWELLTGWWKLPKEQLYATVFEDDKGDLGRDREAADYWVQVTDILPDHVLYFGRKDNFWEMGDTGPCGPCSEIHLDRGPDYCDMQDVPGHLCQVNGDCQRFLEIWNLVFIQYNRHADDQLDPLPAKHVDTGMGFERIVTILQQARTNYETDLFTGIIRQTQKLLGDSGEIPSSRRIAYRVIADHTRAAAFLIADGAMPGNVGRNYVLRMIIRRAARFGKNLGFTGPFMARVAETVVQEMGSFYTELVDRRDHIMNTLTAEEERFQRTLDNALCHLDQLLKELEAQDRNVIDGETAFDLYATYGLPLEITRDLAQEHWFTVDEAGFQAASQAHKKASGSGALGVIDSDKMGVYANLMDVLIERGLIAGDGVDHDPYGELELSTQLAAILQDGQAVESAVPGAEIEIVLAATPFYAESGGQVSDAGEIRNGQDWLVEITGASKPVPGLVIHAGRVVRGQPAVGDPVIAAVDREKRRDIMRNHTATHLLHRELRAVLGDHVLQQGSLVAADRLRFDFNHTAPVSPDELAEIERRVNRAVLENYPVVAGHTSLTDAKERGAMALFGEKYGEIVRTIQVGGPEHSYSMELCGGTHVTETAEIGLFHILNEGSIGANLRRVEAVTGSAAQKLVQERLRGLDNSAARLNTSPAQVEFKIDGLLNEVQAAQKEISRLQRELARVTFARLMDSKVQKAAGVPVLTAVVNAASIDSMREIADWFR